MSGLLALLDDVAALAKVAATSIDDVASQAVKTTAKVAGGVLDDAAVTPKYTMGFSAERELPIVGRIAWGSIRNKMLILLPVAMLLSNLAPWAIAPLLMLGGGYLCFEGAEKILHSIRPHHAEAEKSAEPTDPARLEESRVAGAIKTDFILSAEIMTIALSAIPDTGLVSEALTLALVAVGITVLVYGSVALIVKADDVGLLMARKGRLGLTRWLGRGIVQGMPTFMSVLTIVGTAAMLWVGGSIVIHGMEELGFGTLGHVIHDIAQDVAQMVPESWSESWAGTVSWTVTAVLDGIFGIALGLVLVPVTTWVIAPVAGVFSKSK